MMYVSHDPQDTHTRQILTCLLELQNMKSSTVVLSNSGHDHLRNFEFSFRRSRALRAWSVQPPRPSTFCLRQRDVFQEVCAAFFRLRIRFVWECHNSVGSEIKDIGRSNRKASVADCVARGPHITKYTTRMYPSCFPLKNDLNVKRSQMHDSSNGSGAFRGHTTHHREKSKKRE